MSTVIDVYPSRSVVPTFAEFSSGLHAVLLEQQAHPVFEGVFGQLDLSATRHEIERVSEAPDRRSIQRFGDPNELLAFHGGDYAWLSLPMANAGFDFYHISEDDHVDDFLHRDIIDDYAARAATIGTLSEFPFDRAAHVGWSWCMRLQATQPLRTRLLAGYAAAAVARITNGFIHSEDGGVDHDRAPTDPETFLTWYPEWIEREMDGSQEAQPSSLDT